MRENLGSGSAGKGRGSRVAGVEDGERSVNGAGGQPVAGVVPGSAGSTLVQLQQRLLHRRRRRAIDLSWGCVSEPA